MCLRHKRAASEAGNTEESAAVREREKIQQSEETMCVGFKF